VSTESDADEPVPKLPRGRGMRFSGPELFRIVLTLATLVGVVILAKPCGNAVSSFVMGMDGSGSASAAKQMPKPGTVDVPQPTNLEQLKPGMTEAEYKALIERSRAKAAPAMGSGSAAPAMGSGSVAPAPGSGTSAP
jgi:hypothetical protein